LSAKIPLLFKPQVRDLPRNVKHVKSSSTDDALSSLQYYPCPKWEICLGTPSTSKAATSTLLRRRRNTTRATIVSKVHNVIDIHVHNYSTPTTCSPYYFVYAVCSAFMSSVWRCVPHRLTTMLNVWPWEKKRAKENTT
jgi:hypothetical protein